MNEPKKRGRPAKAKPEEMTGTQAWSAVVTPSLADAEIKLAQAYALRVWNGQNRDLPRNERMRRVAAALEGQGLSMEGVKL